MVTFTTPVAPLFVPASRPERFPKADTSGADAIILDLEDAVAPGDKEQARKAVASHAADFRSALIIRINAAGTPWHEADLDVVARLKCAAVMLPKTERPDHVRALTARFDHKVTTIALIESAAGLEHLSEILRVAEVAAIAFGSVDFCLDVDCAHERLALLAARSEIVLRSRAANLNPPIDGVTTDLSNPESVEDDARHAMKMGFGGKMAIHPKQIEPIRRSFCPTEKEIAWARDILEIGASGEAMQIAGEMVDRPVVERARRILGRAALILG